MFDNCLLKMYFYLKCQKNEMIIGETVSNFKSFLEHDNEIAQNQTDKDL